VPADAGGAAQPVSVAFGPARLHFAFGATRMSRKRITYLSCALIAGVAVFQVLPWWLGGQDFASLQRKGVPRFARLAAPPPDGGSTHYEGFGYTLWNLHRLTNFGVGRHGLVVGPSIEYWFPIGLTRNRQQTVALDKTEEWGWGTEQESKVKNHK